MSTGCGFFLDQVPGRDDRITYALGLNPDGSIKAIEVLVCVAEYDQVRGDWRRNFVGRRFSRSHLGESIPNISGSTLSVAHMADGITRLLATHALFIAPGEGLNAPSRCSARWSRSPASACPPPRHTRRSTQPSPSSPRSMR